MKVWTADHCSLAELEQIERILNTYLREFQLWNPLLSENPSIYGKVPLSIVKQIQKRAMPMFIELSVTNTIILGGLRYLSLLGHHKYGNDFWIGVKEAEGSSATPLFKPTSISELIDALITEIVHKQSNVEVGNVRKQWMLNQICISMDNVQRFLERKPAVPGSLWDLNGVERVQTVEQSLLYGHPFHPAPKSSEGFSVEEVFQYAPEMGVIFALHYFAAEPGIVLEEWIGGTVEPIPKDVLAAAQSRLSPEFRHYMLLPSHPWQAQYLMKLPEVKRLIKADQLVYLGEMGNQVVPTSSVRSVWDPENLFIYKLPLNVKITNFIRVNPLGQLKRAIAASNILSCLIPKIPFPDFNIILEEGYRTISGEIGMEADEKLMESFGVIYRRNPAWLQDQGDLQEVDAPLVIASLLEARSSLTRTLLHEAICLSAKQRHSVPSSGFVHEWLRRYLEISFVPLLWLFMKYGISMEAHVQNSLVALESGWPSQFFVRDLEGTSISRERAFGNQDAGGIGNIGISIPEQSPALYADNEAWKRFKYYVLVNHLGHVIHTIAYSFNQQELALWKTVYDVIRDSECLHEAYGHSYLEDLLTGEHLPAKANLTSWFHNRGENPMYVNIPNPLYAVCEKTNMEA